MRRPLQDTGAAAAVQEQSLNLKGLSFALGICPVWGGCRGSCWRGDLASISWGCLIKICRVHRDAWGWHLELLVLCATRVTCSTSDNVCMWKSMANCYSELQVSQSCEAAGPKPTPCPPPRQALPLANYSWMLAG